MNVSHFLRGTSFPFLTAFFFFFTAFIHEWMRFPVPGRRSLVETWLLRPACESGSDRGWRPRWHRGGQFWWWCGWTAVPRSFLPSLEMSCPSGAWLTECRKCRGRDRNCGFSDNFACRNGPFPVSWWADDKSNSKYTTLPALTSPFCLSFLCLEAGLASPREILVYPWTGL